MSATTCWAGSGNPEAERRLLAEASRRRDTPSADDQLAFEAMDSAALVRPGAVRRRRVRRPTDVGSPEEQDYLGLPGLLEPDQVRALLRRRRSRAEPAGRAGPSAAGTEAAPGTRSSPSCAGS